MTVYDHEDLRGKTVELADPANTQFIGCTFSDFEEVDGVVRPVNQCTIITNGYGREYLGCVGTPIEVGG